MRYCPHIQVASHTSYIVDFMYQLIPFATKYHEHVVYNEICSQQRMQTQQPNGKLFTLSNHIGSPQSPCLPESQHRAVVVQRRAF